MDDPELSALIRDRATRHAAPASLRAAVRTQAAIAAAGRPARAPRRRWLAWGWPELGLGFALGLACAIGGPQAWRALQGPDDADLVAAHVQALRTGPLIEVASSDRHTVKPWFQGRIDYAPPVLDFTGAGFPLLGGRVDHDDGHAVAVLVYRRDRHLIDLTIAPESSRSANMGRRTPRAAVVRGFHLLRWSDGAMRYSAVSDVEPAELARFAELWQAPPATR
ncbi:MAG: anti-sigma factor [Burkholderiales bacterium]|nr:anti-sigma factor [Burkholderiales bacterium]